MRLKLENQDDKEPNKAARELRDSGNLFGGLSIFSNNRIFDMGDFKIPDR